jgi:hypothetical protein
MIDARDQIGTPVITDCPSYVWFAGKLYEIAADALVFNPGPIKFEADHEASLFDKLHTFAPYYWDGRHD